MHRTVSVSVARVKATRTVVNAQVALILPTRLDVNVGAVYPLIPVALSTRLVVSVQAANQISMIRVAHVQVVLLDTYKHLEKESSCIHIIGMEIGKQCLKMH